MSVPVISGGHYIHIQGKVYGLLQPYLIGVNGPKARNRQLVQAVEEY